MLESNNAQDLSYDDISLYCPGGAGIGIGKYFESERNLEVPGFARIHPVYMDTSKASKFGVPENYFYHLEKAPGEEADGSGGLRSEHGALIMQYTNEILQKFPPKKWVIVIHAASGGSGSVMGPSLVSELLARGHTVFVFTVGDDATLNFIKNSISVVAGYENIANLRERGVIFDYLQNGKDGTVEEVDAKIQQSISCLAALLSGQNKNLDSQDIKNVFDFSRKGVTSFGPQVGMLHIDHGKLEVGDRSIISLATLNDSLNNTRVSQPVEFQRVGIPMHIKSQGRALVYPLHFAVTDGFLDVLMKNLRKQKDEFEQRAAGRVVRNQLTTGKEKVAGNGLVFDE